eukprot:6726057-Alexandrium_andersonii.AAC.1
MQRQTQRQTQTQTQARARTHALAIFGPRAPVGHGLPVRPAVADAETLVAKRHGAALRAICEATG